MKEKEILKLIEKSKKDYDKNVQRAELLARNEIFLTELRKINKYISKEFHLMKSLSEDELTEVSKNNILLKLDYPRKCTSEKDFWRISNELDDNFEALLTTKPIDEWYLLKDNERTPFRNKSEEVIFHKYYIFKNFLHLWRGFCTKWHIHPDWNGSFDTLGKFQRSLIEIIVGSPRQINFCNSLPIIIKIGPWTSMKDIENVWSEIEKIQKTKFYKEVKSSNFFRDLCWYDLNKIFNLKPKQIAEIWIDKFPEDIDLLVIRRIKNKIEKKDLNGKVLSDDDLLRAIKSGFLKSKYKSDFDEEKEWYVSGQTERGKFNPPFMDLIKKAVKRFETRIHILDLPSPIDVMHPSEP